MNELDENLFYSPSERILFFVAGYTDNSLMVGKITDTLNTGAKKLADLIGEKKKIFLPLLLRNQEGIKT